MTSADIPPPPPKNVRHINGLTHEETPCELAYVGLDERGINQWDILTDVEFDPVRGDSFTIAVLPPKTGLAFRVPKGLTRKEEET